MAYIPLDKEKKESALVPKTICKLYVREEPTQGDGIGAQWNWEMSFQVIVFLG